MVAQGNVEGTPPKGRQEGAPRPPAEPSPRPQAPCPSPERQTHFRPFRNERDFRLITTTSAMLENSGFYWGPMTVEDAHARLRGERPGTFLIRDSQRRDFFFTLSYRTLSGPVSVRISFQGSRFGLVGSRESFESLFELLEHYVASPKSSLTAPYRKARLRSLQELCRQRIMETWGAERIDRIPINAVLKDFLRSFPFRL